MRRTALYLSHKQKQKVTRDLTVLQIKYVVLSLFTQNYFPENLLAMVHETKVCSIIFTHFVGEFLSNLKKKLHFTELLLVRNI